MIKFFKRMEMDAVSRCASCMHFRNDPAYLERNVPGLAMMSSAHASVRADDGICELHGRYLSARSTRAEHMAINKAGATNCRMVVEEKTN